MSSAPPEKFIFYHYTPSIAAAVVFIVVFGISAILHVFQLVKNRTWYFIPFVIGCLLEAIGYVGRALGHNQAPDFTTGPYIMQSLTILISPAFFAASIYMILGRIIVITDGEHASLIRSSWLTKIFVGGDVLSFLAQSAGGGIMASADTNDDAKKGEKIIMGGLGIQILFFAVFAICAFIFHVRINKAPTRTSESLTVPWVRQLYVLYAASILILVRSVFRLIEYLMGNDGYLLTHEVYLYIFDATLMAITAILFNAFHPCHVVSRQMLKASRQHNSSSSDDYTLEEQTTTRHSRKH